MGDMTLKAIGEHLCIPEATLRFYRDRYADFIPYSGEGRTRRYPVAAIEIYHTIAEQTKAGKKPEEITAFLYNLYPVNATATTATQTQDQLERPRRETKTIVMDEEINTNAMTAMQTQGKFERLPQSLPTTITSLVEGQNALLDKLISLWEKRNALAADSLPDILTIQEAAALARISSDTLRKKMKADPTFPVQYFGTRKRIPKEQFLRWMGGGI